MRIATYASTGTAMLIILMKIVAWLFTGSLSLLSSLIDSFLDIGASLVNLFAVRYALQPADDDHRFGHGKAEDIAAMLQAAFIVGSAVFITIEAIKRFIEPAPISNAGIGISVMVASALLTAVLVTFQRYVIRLTGSNVIKADSLHYMTDLSVNLAVILGFIIVHYTLWDWVDPLLALGIAAYIFIAAWHVARDAFDRLMDKELPESTRQRIMHVVLAHKEVRGLHDLRTRYVGHRPFIQFHVELDGDMTLDRAHQISDEVEANIIAAFPDAEVIIHQDPEEDEPVALELEGVKAVRL
jgi:ferrous-iron efflux pump FieF